MENAADALKIAAFVLIFVVTLTITISSFTEVRQTTQTLLEYQDKTFDYEYVNYKDEEGNLITERIVGIESIVPTVYRAFLENYTIYFYDNSGQPLELYYKEKKDGGKEIYNIIDLSREDIINLPNDEKKEEFILTLLYGQKYEKWKELTDYLSVEYKIKLSSDLQNRGLYGKIKGSSSEGLKFYEKLGEYYEEDIKEEGETTTPETNIEPNDDNSVPEVNKQKKRIITYTQYT